MTSPDLLSPRAAAQAKQLEFFARTRVEGFLKSVNPSALKGHSTDFRQHREYVPGDDLRRLDWRILARTDRLVTREYDEYTNLDAFLVLDASGSMAYPADGFPKLDFCRHCAAMLAYILHLQRDRVALALTTDTVTELVRPASGRKHLAELYRRIAAVRPGGETDLAACVPQLNARVRRKSAFVFFSDCYEEPQALMKAMGALQLQGHDVLLYQVFDPNEEDLPFPGFTLFRDLETGQVDAADPLEIRQAYHEVFREHVRSLQDAANRFAIEFHSLPVRSDWDAVLAALLHKRAARS
jgi:uncharacterized protein (DUF58 family)